MDVQFQIRQNAMEMQEYMKDLFDWQKSIKKKERTITASSSSGAQQSAAPAPRGRASGTVAPAPSALMAPALGPKGSAPGPASAAPSTSDRQSQPSASSSSSAKKHAAEHTYSSYSKWDKFDVDAALASDDDDQQTRDRPKPVQPLKSAAANSQEPASGIASTPGSLGSHSSPLPQENANAEPLRPPQTQSRGSSAAAAAATAPAAPAVSAPGIMFREAADGDPDQLLRPVTTTRLRGSDASPAAPSSIAAPAAPSHSRESQPHFAAAPPAAAADLTAALEPAGTRADEGAARGLPPVRNSQPTTPEAWRARGNDLFKAGQYDSAYECYSRSVELQPTCLGHANRAMALLKLGRWQEAVADCSEAIRLDPSYVKAFQRRAAAHRQLGALADAARDWEAALRLEPENRATAADRDAALEQLMAEQKLQPPSRRAAVQVAWPALHGPAAALAAAPVQAGSVLSPAVNDGMGRSVAAQAASTAPAKPQLPHAVGGPAAQTAEGQPNGEAGAAQGVGAGGPAAGGLQPSEAAMPATAAASGAPPPDPDPLNGGPLAQDPAELSPTGRPAAVAAAAAVGAPPAVTRTRGSTGAVAATAAAAAALGCSGSSGTGAAAGRPVPKTSVEFESAWRSLSGDPAGQAAYLAAIPPASLPAVFKNSLTAPVLAAILRCLLAAMTTATAGGGDPGDGTREPTLGAGPGPGSGQPAGVSSGPAPAVLALGRGAALLEGLTRVARFDLMAMSVPSRERAGLRAEWEGLETALAAAEDGEGQEVRQRLSGLRAKYRL